MSDWLSVTWILIQEGKEDGEVFIFKSAWTISEREREIVNEVGVHRMIGGYLSVVACQPSCLVRKQEGDFLDKGRTIMHKT